MLFQSRSKIIKTIDTNELSQILSVESRLIYRIIRNNMDFMLSLGPLPDFKSGTSEIGGRPVEGYILNISQVKFVISCFSSTRRALKWKMICSLKDESKILTELKKTTNQTKRSGNIYVIETSMGTCKIGFSIRPESRISQILTQGNLVLTRKFISEKIENYTKVEKECHIKFDSDRLSGEWFSSNFEDIINFVKQRVEGFASIIGKTPLSVAICDNSQRKIK